MSWFPSTKGLKLDSKYTLESKKIIKKKKKLNISQVRPGSNRKFNALKTHSKGTPCTAAGVYFNITE